MSSSSRYLFSYAAKGLQSYIMRGGKLRDMVGATSLIDKLADRQQLEHWLTKSFGWSTPQDFIVHQAAAGAARIEFRDLQKAQTMATIWPLWCHAWAPDLEVVQTLVAWPPGRSYGEVSQLMGQKLERARNFPAPRLPEAGPFARRAPRTGEPAVPVTKDLLGDDDLIDLATRRKRQERSALREGNELPPVAAAFGLSHADQLPDDFLQIAGSERAYLAVVHADGNGLGQMFLAVGQALTALKPETLSDEVALKLLDYLSQQVVAEGTRAAVRQAMDVLPMKARPADKPWLVAPVVLAGDDLTLVCRADLGLPLTEAFLKAFRAQMRNRLALLQQQPWWTEVEKNPALCQAIPTELSAGAGIVFCSNHYPFALAYELCEDLARQAKNQAKERAREANSATPDSALAFLRVTGASAPTEWEDWVEGYLKGADGSLLTGAPYFVDGDPDKVQPQIAALWKVYEAARPRDDGEGHRLGLPGSSLRGLLNLQRTDASKVPQAVARMLQVAGERARPFEGAWKELCSRPNATQTTSEGKGLPTDWHDLQFYDARATGGKARSPLGDLITLLAVRDKSDDATQRVEPSQQSTEQPYAASNA